MKPTDVYVESCVNCTVVIEIPEDRFRKEWVKKGQKYPIDKEYLDQIMYNRDVEALFKGGYLKCADKEFMENNGLIKENGEPLLLELTDNLMKRMIGAMPMSEFKETLKKLTKGQSTELVAYAIDHPDELKLEKADLLTKITGKQILKAIEFAKAD